MNTLTENALELRACTAGYGDHTLWREITLALRRGEFLAVLGPNGSGKTTLFKLLLGLEEPLSGEILVNGRPPTKGDATIGYIPQQRAFDQDLPARAWDIVALGLDGHRYGLPWRSKESRRAVDDALASVGATAFAQAPIGRLSGGQQQRVRVAQALVGNPSILLCDEPLLSLDPRQQIIVTTLIETRRREAGSAVVFITHEINPVLPFADRILYIVEGKWRIGTPEEVLDTATLSELFGRAVDVFHIDGSILTVPHAEGDTAMHHHFEDETGKH